MDGQQQQVTTALATTLSFVRDVQQERRSNQEAANLVRKGKLLLESTLRVLLAPKESTKLKTPHQRTAARAVVWERLVIKPHKFLQQQLVKIVSSDGGRQRWEQCRARRAARESTTIKLDRTPRWTVRIVQQASTTTWKLRTH